MFPGKPFCLKVAKNHISVCNSRTYARFGRSSKSTEPLQIAIRSLKNARRGRFRGSKSGKTAVTLVFYASSRANGILGGSDLSSPLYHAFLRFYGASYEAMLTPLEIPPIAGVSSKSVLHLTGLKSLTGL